MRLEPFCYEGPLGCWVVPPPRSHHRRVGLIHLNRGKAGAELSGDLLALAFDVAFIEIEDNEPVLHGFINMLISKVHGLHYRHYVRPHDHGPHAIAWPLFQRIKAGHVNKVVVVMTGSPASLRMAVQSVKEVDNQLNDHRMQLFSPGKVFFLFLQWMGGLSLDNQTYILSTQFLPVCSLVLGRSVQHEVR